MRTLADAWNWYEATKRTLLRMQRLGEKHWTDPSLAGASIWRDDHFKMVETSHIEADTKVSLELIDDLAVVVLFSVYESLVRDYLIEQIEPEVERITDPILRHAADGARQGIQEGSFFLRVLEPLKKQGRVSADLVTEVDQVRDYRNWVAHGRRDAPTNKVTPEMAFSRLRKLLGALGIAAEPEQARPD